MPQEDPNTKAARKLSATADEYLKQYSNTDDAARTALREVEMALNEARRARLKDAITPIGSFFSDIGKGVVDAQKALDAQSKQYIAELLKEANDKRKDKSNDPEITEVPGASMFRIPRVSAELKLSLEKTLDSDWNVVFYSKEEQTKELQQQSLQFEIVSVPIPPGYAQLVNLPVVKSAPAPGGVVRVRGLDSESEDAESEPRARASAFVEGEPPRARASLPSRSPDSKGSVPFSAGEELRDRLREDITILAERMPTVQRRRVETQLLPSWDRALVLSADADTAFVLLTKEGKSPELLIWQVVLQPASLKELYRMPATAAARRDLHRVRSFVQALERLARGDRTRKA
ncbi:MAG: hypothetical protein U0441_38290 [Polyangiaceae bacterium]